MKKLFSILLLTTILFGLIKIEIFAQDKNATYFIVTAYYSPLPNQNFYLKGNYQDELRLNGMGIAGASGKKVFSGMLAAPKNYKFGTKIHLEGLGIGSVEDRGGAIVNAGNRGYQNDRIDVWMGYGDEGLRRALYWGKRKVKGTILSKNSIVNLDINNISSPLWATKNLEKIIFNSKTIYQNTSADTELKLFNKYLYKNSNKDDILLLQKTLKELSLYNGELTGNYNDILDILINYQITKKLISNADAYGAGYFGPKTRKNMKQDYENYLMQKKQEEERRIYLANKIEELQKISNIKVTSLMNSIGKPIFGDVAPEVRELQIALKDLGYFDYKDTAIFGKITKDSITKFQLSNNIISSTTDKGSGYFGPKTREVFKLNAKKQILTKLLFQEEITIDEVAQIINSQI